MGDSEDEDVTAERPGVLSPLVGNWDKIEPIIAMLAAARRGDLDERTTCADEDCVMLKSAAARPLTDTPSASVTETMNLSGRCCRRRRPPGRLVPLQPYLAPQ
jgi:hypothetical protein